MLFAYSVMPSMMWVRRLLLRPLRTQVLQSFRQDPRRTLCILAAELQNSGNPATSMLLLWLMEQIALATPDTLVLRNVFDKFPGDNLVEKLLSLPKGLRFLFLAKLFDGGTFDPYPKPQSLPAESVQVHQRSAFPMLEPDEDAALLRWFEKHGPQHSAKSSYDATFIAQLKDAALEGDADAEYLLSCAYTRGELVGRDIEEAVRLLHSAAEGNSVDAQYTLGSFLLPRTSGCTRPTYWLIRRRWLREAVRQGNAQARLALMRYID